MGSRTHAAGTRDAFVVLLGEQPGRRPARGSIALEPACCRHVVSLLREGERGDEPAQDEGALRVAEGYRA
jgi:hypothetical protein